MTQQASTAVQQTANGGQVATQRKPVDILKSMMNAESVQEQFKNALGKNSATFVASVIDLYNGDSNLQLCNPKQVVMEALKAATLHLPINKALGYAFIIPFKNSKKDEKGNWIKVYEPTFQMGYKGYIQLAMRTGQYRTINADVVYDGELRKVNKLTGEIAFDGERKSDKVIGYFLSGHIVNVPQCQAAYNASKAGVIHMTKSLAIEWIDKNIRVNSVSPGYVATPMSVDPDFVEPELMAAWQPMFPMHRMAKPEELCGAIIWLCSESAGYTTGADILIDGAYTVL